MHRQIIVRLIIDIFILIVVISGWWQISLLFAIAGLLFLPHFLEIIFFGIMFDALFGYHISLGIAGYIGTIFSIFSYLIIDWLKSLLRR